MKVKRCTTPVLASNVFHSTRSFQSTRPDQITLVLLRSASCIFGKILTNKNCTVSRKSYSYCTCTRSAISRWQAVCSVPCCSVESFVESYVEALFCWKQCSLESYSVERLFCWRPFLFKGCFCFSIEMLLFLGQVFVRLSTGIQSGPPRQFLKVFFTPLGFAFADLPLLTCVWTRSCVHTLLFQIFFVGWSLPSLKNQSNKDYCFFGFWGCLAISISTKRTLSSSVKC